MHISSGRHPLDPGMPAKCMVQVWSRLYMVDQVHHPHPKGGTQAINGQCWDP